jgi:hypothetical protein
MQKRASVTWKLELNARFDGVCLAQLTLRAKPHCPTIDVVCWKQLTLRAKPHCPTKGGQQSKREENAQKGQTTLPHEGDSQDAAKECAKCRLLLFRLLLGGCVAPKSGRVLSDLIVATMSQQNFKPGEKSDILAVQDE